MWVGEKRRFRSWLQYREGEPSPKQKTRKTNLNFATFSQEEREAFRKKRKKSQPTIEKEDK